MEADLSHVADVDTHISQHHRIRNQAGVLVGERGLFLGSPAVQARLRAVVGDEDSHLDFLGVDVVLCESERRHRLKKRGRTGPGMMRGPVWGGRQAAGKADSQAFCGKRLPHPWGGS